MEPQFGQQEEELVIGSKYLLKEEIGRGASGRVHRAIDRTLNEDVAIKILSIDGPIPGEVFREISCLKVVRHPNIIRLKDVVMKESQIYIVMELMEKTLETFIRESVNGIEESTAKIILKQIFAGLDHIHTLNIVHCDINPSNIMFDENNVLNIIDFGLARVIIGALLAEDLQSDPSNIYTAPECLENSPCGPSLDIWATGCIYAELLLGKPLFDRSGDLLQYVTISRLMAGESTSNQDSTTEEKDVVKLQQILHDEGFDLLKKMLCMEPSKRITAAQALEHAYLKE